ncbi:D-sedoheptulose 7-phosphate isomerase [Caminibacter sp.]
MLKKCLYEHIEIAGKMKSKLPLIEKAAKMCIYSLKNHKKILLCGNGGSAADSQHIAAELTGRFKNDRISLPAIALTTDTSALTAISNDYGFEYVFSRQIKGLGNEGDVLIAISTSGNSKNIIQAVKTAKDKNIKIITLTGRDGGKISAIGDVNIVVPSDNTPRIQEMHIMIGHMICEMIDRDFNVNANIQR